MADATQSGRSTWTPQTVGWLHPSVVVAAAFSIYAGYAQFTATAALPDIARAFGEVPTALPADASITQRLGLSGTTLGLGLAIMRLSSLGALPLARQADRHGRRRVLLTVSSVALVLTAVAAGMPSFWLLVLVLSLARPLMSTTNAIAGVVAAEEVATIDRSKAIAMVTVGYGIGAGIPIVLRGATEGTISFRTLFLLAVPMLLTLPLLTRFVKEPDRAAHARSGATVEVSKKLGRVPPELRPRLLLLCTLTFFVSLLTGPINTFLFIYAESVAGVRASTLAVVAPAAAAIGGLGLVLGVRLADRFGRITTAMWTKVAVSACAVLTYSAGASGAVIGYIASLFVGSSYAPAVGATAAEIFPTSIRATAAGWITFSTTIGAVTGLFGFGWVLDVSGSFTTASLVVSVPCALSAIGYRWLPETRGLELEESAPDPV